MQGSRSSSVRVAPWEIDEEEASERKTELESEGNSIDSTTNGNIWSCIFHLVASGIGVHALLLPLSFATLGWAWGVACLVVGFIWQLYTKWLLIQLHEPTFGVRYSRFTQLALAAFGLRLGTPVALLNAAYLSSQCVQMIIMGSSTLKHLYALICSDGYYSYCPKQLSSVEWHVVFVFLAILLIQHPNLSSLRWVSLFGTVTSLLCCTLLWVMSLVKGKVDHVSYNPTYDDFKTPFGRILSASFALQIIGLSMRGHSLILEIQGTLPSTLKHPSHKTMWKAVKVSYLLIALSIFPIAIGGYWAFGDKVTKQGLLYSLEKFHRDEKSMTAFSLAFLFLSIHNLCSYPLHAMLTFGNIEFAYLTVAKKPCSVWLRRVIRLFYAGVTLLISVAFPFMPSLAPIVGGITIMPLTFAYPCFMWIAINKPKPLGFMFLLNSGLGCLGIIMTVLLLVLAICKISREGLEANFFHPQ